MEVKAHNSDSEESALDHCVSSRRRESTESPAYLSWPTLGLHKAAEERAEFFRNLQKRIYYDTLVKTHVGKKATTLLELMTIRAFHIQLLRHSSLGTAIGFRVRGGEVTDIPAILVFVTKKVHKQWLDSAHCLPSMLEGPGGVWCDVDVLEFSNYPGTEAPPKQEFCTELIDGVGGRDRSIGPGSQVSNIENFGTLGAIVKSRTGIRQVGFLTNRHVGVDLAYPDQKMFHPLPPNVGAGVYLGAVKRATSFITDDLWYGTFAGVNPETFVRADGAFIPFADDFDMSSVTTRVKGVGEIGKVKIIDLQSPVNSVVGKQVVKVGRSTGLTYGTIMAYALEYNDAKGLCIFTDILVVGENKQTFDVEGDSGSLIILTSQNGEKPLPIGIIWGGTSNRGRMKSKLGELPVNWTSGVDLGRLLDLLELDLISTNEELREAIKDQRNASAAAGDSTVDEASPEEGAKPNGTSIRISERRGFDLEKIPVEEEESDPIPVLYPPFILCTNGEKTPNVEHQFITNLMESSPMNQNNHDHTEAKDLSKLKNVSEDDLPSLELGDRVPKRRRLADEEKYSG